MSLMFDLVKLESSVKNLKALGFSVSFQVKRVTLTDRDLLTYDKLGSLKIDFVRNELFTNLVRFVKTGTRKKIPISYLFFH